MRRFALILFALSILTGMAAVLSYGDELTGLQIMQRVDNRDDGDDISQKIDQQLIDRRGGVRRRHMIAFRKDYGKDKKQISYFLKPANIRDTALLTYDYHGATRDDDQWLYLPALKRVRRISASDRGDYFMGTDFTFEDIKQTPELEDYIWTLTGSGMVDGHDCWKVQGAPRTDDLKNDLGYSRTVSFVRKDNDVVIRVDYWDRKGQELKHLRVTGLIQIQGIWTATSIRMENVQTGHKTIMTFSEQRYNQGLPDRTFSERMLKRGYRGK